MKCSSTRVIPGPGITACHSSLAVYQTLAIKANNTQGRPVADESLYVPHAKEVNSRPYLLQGLSNHCELVALVWRLRKAFEG